MKLFLVGLTGNYPALFYLTFLGGLLVTEFLTFFEIWFLGYGASQYEDHLASEVSVS
jgi:hypothetical protein